MNERPILLVEGLNVDIGPANILREAALAIPAGMMCGLIGRNGAGKTTLMRSVMGLVPARSGSILFDARDLRAVAPFRRAHLGIGYMPEDRRLMPHLTAEENVLLPAWITGTSESARRLAALGGTMPGLKNVPRRRLART